MNFWFLSSIGNSSYAFTHWPPVFFSYGLEERLVPTRYLWVLGTPCQEEWLIQASVIWLVFQPPAWKVPAPDPAETQQLAPSAEISSLAREFSPDFNQVPWHW